MSIGSLLKAIYQHPYNRRHPSFALYRLLRWQAQKRIFGTPAIYKFWGTRSIVCYPDALGSMWLVYMYFMDWPEFWFLKRYLRADDITFDIGANLGIYTLWMSQFTSASQFAFEPDSKNYDRTLENIQLNNLSARVRVENVAVSNQAGKALFSTGHDTENRLVTDPANVRGVREVPVIRLDDYVIEKGIDRINFLKVDVEGAEYMVLQGAAQLLGEGRVDVIQLEVLDIIGRFNRSRAELYDLLEGYGYMCYTYEPSNNQLQRVTSLDTVPQNVFAIQDYDMVSGRLS